MPNHLARLARTRAAEVHQELIEQEAVQRGEQLAATHDIASHPAASNSTTQRKRK